MRVSALKTFAGRVGMKAGEVMEISDKKVLADLLRCGYIREVKRENEGIGGEPHRRKKGSGN